MSGIKIDKIFRISCPDCGEVHEDATWRGARSWLPRHRKANKLCGELHLPPSATKRLDVPRSKRGHIIYGEVVACPICFEERLITSDQLHTSRKRNASHPELVGVHRSCRMRVVKPALGKRRTGSGV